MFGSLFTNPDDYASIKAIREGVTTLETIIETAAKKEGVKAHAIPATGKDATSSVSQQPTLRR